MNAYTYILEKIRDQDFFAQQVSLRYKGKDSFTTILVVLGVTVQSSFALHQLVTKPEYNQYPTTYDYAYTNNVTVDLRENMPAAYSMADFGYDTYSYLRVVFFDGKGNNVPAVLCKDFFAAEIQAEASG